MVFRISISFSLRASAYTMQDCDAMYSFTALPVPEFAPVISTIYFFNFPVYDYLKIYFNSTDITVRFRSIITYFLQVARPD